MGPGLLSFPFFTVLRIPFLPVRLAFVDASTGPWLRLTTSPPLECPHPQYEVCQSKAKAWVPVSFSEMVSCCQRKPHLNPKPDGYQGGRNSVGGALTSSTETRKKGSHMGYHS